MELLYADDLVLVAETEELLMEKLCKWKRGMELKGLRVNIGKSKVRIGQAEETGKYPCGVCRQGVGDNSIKYVACHKWIKGVVVFQVDWGMLLISAAEGVWMGFKNCWKLSAESVYILRAHSRPLLTRT